MLRADFVRSVTKPGKYHDAHGLILRVTPGGSKQWIWRGTVRGRRRDLGLGSVTYMSLHEARDRAFEYRKFAREGGDPSAHRSNPSIPTLAEACQMVIDRRRPTWRSPRSAAQWEASLRDYALPSIGDKPVTEITSGDIRRVLDPIWNTKEETARRVKQRLSIVMEWVISEDLREDNPVQGALRGLPKQDKRREHFRALPYVEVAAAVETVRGTAAWPATKACFEFVILTACRSGEARGALWQEINEDTWTIPGARTKTRFEFRVPLSTMALVVLNDIRELSGESGLVFPSATGRQLSNNTMRKLLIDNGFNVTIHGFRSSFRDWCPENDVTREVAELCLAHVATGVEGAYRRTDLLESRRAVMEEWGWYVNGMSS